jgi:hypothetical protein
LNVLKYDSATIHRIKDDIQAAFGHTVDLGERSTLTTKAAETAARDRVRVF